MTGTATPHGAADEQSLDRYLFGVRARARCHRRREAMSERKLILEPIRLGLRGDTECYACGRPGASKTELSAETGQPIATWHWACLKEKGWIE